MTPSGSGSPQTPVPGRRQQLIVWAAFAWSVAMYFVVLQIVAAPPIRENRGLLNSLTVLAAMMVAASFPLKKRAGLIVGLAMCEATAVLGVIVRFVSGSPQYYWFLLLGLAGILLHYPKREA